MERLKELLSDGYLNTAAYFTESWRLFLEMLKNEKKWIFFNIYVIYCFKESLQYIC